MSRQSLPSRTILQVGVVTLLLFGAVAPATSAVGHPGTDNTVTRIDVRADGSAQWTVQIRTRLNTDESVENYERFQAEFRENKSSLFDPFRDRIERIVGQAASVTGRPMEATNFSATTSIQAVPRRWGVVTFSFTWDEFAEQQNDELVVGDAFDGGFFITTNDSLQISGPDGYGIADVRPDPAERQGGTVTWTGRRDFTDNRPHVRFSQDAAVTDSTGTSGTGFGWLPLVGGALLLALVAGGLVYRVRRGDTATAGPDAIGAQAASTTAASADPEPVTDDERIVQILEASGGRMKQTDIVDAVDWSKSKVSRVTAKLAEEGVLSKTQIGRENVVELDRDGEDS